MFKKNENLKNSIANSKCWNCVFEINVGCNMQEGNSNLQDGKVNADVKIWVESLEFARGYKNWMVFQLWSYATWRLGGEFESLVGLLHWEICRTQSTLAINDSAVCTAFVFGSWSFYHSSPRPFTFQSNEKVRTREVLAISCSGKSWQPKNAYHSRCDLNWCLYSYCNFSLKICG